MKKKYVNPTLEVFDYIPEGQILSPSEFSGGFGTGTGTVDGNDGMTNKRQPASSPWDSSNWSTKE